MAKAQVVAAVIERSGRFLVGKRSSWKRAAPHYWSPIQGAVEAGETQEAAVVREANEEVGLVVEVVRKLGEADSMDNSARIHWWLVRLIEGSADLKNQEHSELRWVTLKEMESLEPFYQSDLQFFSAAETLIKNAPA